MKRLFTFALAISLSSSLMGGVAWAQVDSEITLTELTEKLWLLSTDQGEYTTNTLAFVGDEGLLLVDTHLFSLIREGIISDCDFEMLADFRPT